MIFGILLAVIISFILIKSYGENFGLFDPKAPWVNWIGNQICFPKKHVYPISKDELIGIVKEAYQQNKKIRAYGGSHSWSNLVCSSDYLINTDKLNKLLDINEQINQVTVEAGIKIYDLNTLLAKNKLALKNLPFNAGVSVAGAIATATHGTGQTGTLPSFVQEITLIAHDGDIFHLTPKSGNQFAAARVNLGVLGIVYSVTLQCAPLFTLEYTRKRSNLATMLPHYKQLVKDNNYFMFMWNPYTDKILTFEWNYTKKPLSYYGILNYVKELIFNNIWIGAVFGQILAWIPQLHPYFIDSIYYLLSEYNSVDYGYKLLTPGTSAKNEIQYYESEIAIPVDLLPQALDSVKKLMREQTQEKTYAFFGILCRFVLADTQAYLSPAYG